MSTVELLYDGITSVILSYLQAMDRTGFDIYIASTIKAEPNIVDQLINLGCTIMEGAMFKIHDDPRITKVGKVIRAHSLDELPQLWNVLIGYISLVGPRPPLSNEVDQYTDYDKQRLLFKPGCMGLW